jgi:hypothetical protein
MPGIPYPFALKIKFYASSQVKWFMFYILPLQWLNMSFVFFIEILHHMGTIFVYYDLKICIYIVNNNFLLFGHLSAFIYLQVEI